MAGRHGGGIDHHRADRDTREPARLHAIPLRISDSLQHPIATTHRSRWSRNADEDGGRARGDVIDYWNRPTSPSA